MHDRSGPGNEAVREESPLFSQPGSPPAFEPSRPLFGSYSKQFEDLFPFTPPDTESELSISDYQDMDDHSWTQSSQPTDWASVDPHEDSLVLTQDPLLEWTNHASSACPGDPSDSAGWFERHGPLVVSTMSPVLSHATQTTHTGNSMSEADASIVSPNMDLAASPGDPSWTSTGPPQFDEAFGASQPVEGDFPLPSQIRDGTHGVFLPTAGGQPSGLGIFNPSSQGGQPAQPGPSFAFRTYDLSRSGDPSVECPSFNGQLLAYQPDDQGYPGVQTVAPIVSSQTFHPYGTTRSYASASMETHGKVPMTLDSFDHGNAPSGAGDCLCSSCVPEPTIRVMTQVQFPEPADVDDFLNLDPDEPPFGNMPMVPDAHTVEEAGNYTLHSDSHAAPDASHVTFDHETDPDLTQYIPRSERKRTRASTPGRRSAYDAGEEGRTHPFYYREPSEDGLYHCPYNTKGPDSCQHRPEKLKCNYHKHIDSHLRPFECKNANCKKVKFSSTACLLRHEREAHGLHGHGNNPWLCHFTTCERSAPARGFPRKYNLCDHMKRVHKYVMPDDEKGPGGGSRKGASRSSKRETHQQAMANGPSHHHPNPAAFLAGPRSAMNGTRKPRSDRRIPFMTPTAVASSSSYIPAMDHHPGIKLEQPTAAAPSDSIAPSLLYPDGAEFGPMTLHHYSQQQQQQMMNSGPPALPPQQQTAPQFFGPLPAPQSEPGFSSSSAPAEQQPIYPPLSPNAIRPPDGGPGLRSIRPRSGSLNSVGGHAGSAGGLDDPATQRARYHQQRMAYMQSSQQQQQAVGPQYPSEAHLRNWDEVGRFE